MPYRWRASRNEPTDEDRQTSSLAAIAVLLVLLICGLAIAKALRDSTRLEDCLMAGRTNCEQLATRGH